jgi:hypothetical protein
MGRRFAAFVAAGFGAMIELFGSLYGQGIVGHGALFGLAGPETLSEATTIGFLMATLTIVIAVAVMFVRDARGLGAVLVIASVVGTLAAGSLFGIGAILALVGATLALRLDRNAPLA